MVNAVHNACIRELLRLVNVHGKASRHMKLLTIKTESRLGTLWDQEECNPLCSKKERWEAARDEELKIPWKGASEGQPPTVAWLASGCGHQRVSGHRIQTSTGHAKQPCGRNNGGGPEAVQELADGSPSDRSKQRVESTTASVCRWDVRICSCRILQ